MWRVWEGSLKYYALGSPNVNACVWASRRNIMVNAALLAQSYHNVMWMQCWDNLCLG